MELVNPADMPSPTSGVSLPAAPPPTEAAPLPKPTDVLKNPVEPYVFKLVDGRDVVIQKYPRSELLLVSKAMGHRSFNPVLQNIYRTVTWVKAIGNLPMPALESCDDFDFVVEHLGDDGLEEVIEEVSARREGLTANLAAAVKN